MRPGIFPPPPVSPSGVAPGGIGTTELADDSVTLAKLAVEVTSLIAEKAVFLGQYNASTNVPPLDDATGSAGEYYFVSTGGNVPDGGSPPIAGLDEYVPSGGVVYHNGTVWLTIPSLVRTDDVANDAITNAKMAPNSVGTTELVNDAVTNIKMAPNSVGTSEIVDEVVTVAKLAPDVISSRPEIVTLTQAAYDALTPDPAIVYLITA